MSAISTSLHELIALLDEENTVDGDSCICICDIVAGAQVLCQQREDRQQLGFCELQRIVRKTEYETKGKATDLVAESVEESDSIDLQNRMHRPRLRLQVLRHIIREKLDDIDKGIRRRHSMLCRGKKSIPPYFERKTHTPV